MPAYEYCCRTCDRVVEVRATVRAYAAEKAAGSTPTCPSCGGEDLRRIFSAVAVATSAGAVPNAGGGCCGGACGCG